MGSNALQRGFSQLRNGSPGALLPRIERFLERERDQLPLWLPVAVGGGIAAWFLLPDANWWLGLIVAAAGIALLGGAMTGGTRLARCITIGTIAIALGCGLAWGRSLVVAAPVLDRPVVTRLTDDVARVEQIPARAIVRIVVAPVDRPDLPPRARINIPEDKVPPGLGAGAEVELRARLMPPAQPALPDSYDFARRAWFDRLGATGSAIGDVRVTRAARTSSLRQELSAHVRARVGGSAGAVAATLATGDRGALPEADAEAMRRSGLAHLLSISGLHVTAVVGAAFLLVLRLLALSPRLALRAPIMLIAAGSGAAVGIAYTLVTGAEVPTVRSCIAALLVLAALAMGREAITLRLIAAGALFVMVLWPESIMGPSFQLSFAAVTAIVALHEMPRVRGWFARREESRARKLGRGLASLLLTGIVVELALMPIALFHFHKAGLYGALANVIAIPLTTFVIMPLEALALLFDVVGLGAPFWWLTGRSLDGLLALAHFTASRPGAVALVPAMAHWLFALAVLAGLWLAIWRSRIRWLGGAVLVGAAFAMALSPVPDLLVTSDGRHVAARGVDGRVAILRDRAGDYVRDTIAESVGSDLELLPLRNRGDARCSRDFCIWQIGKGDEALSVMSSTSSYYVDALDLIRACERVDIVISDRSLPYRCSPRWLKADRRSLRQTGGLAVYLDPPRLRQSRSVGDRHPWRMRSYRRSLNGSGATSPPAGPARIPGRPHSAAARRTN